MFVAASNGNMWPALSRRVNVITGVTALALLLASFAAFDESNIAHAHLFPNAWREGTTRGKGTAAPPEVPMVPEVPVVVDDFLTKPLDVAIVEAGGWHDEVIAALVWTFGAQPNVNLTMRRHRQRFGIQRVIDRFHLGGDVPALQPYARFDDSSIPAVLVSTTCAVDYMDGDSNWGWLLERRRTYLFCVFHHADGWDPSTGNHQRLLPWVRAGLVTFVALSQHTKEFFDEAARGWDLGGGGLARVTVRSRYLAPVFPVDLSGTQYDATVPAAGGGGGGSADDTLSFALQGNYEPTRRDYGKIFAEMGAYLNRTDAGGDGGARPDLQLRLLGSGQRPAVPEFLQGHVKFDEGLDYLDFYGILSQSSALVPAFVGSDYLDRKASSTVPAGLIAGTPLVATQAILDRYTYLPRGAVWYQPEGETDLDVVGRVLAAPPAERAARKAAVRAARDELMAANRVMVTQWMREAVDRVREVQAEARTPEEEAAQQLST